MSDNSMNAFDNMATSIRYMDAVNGEQLLVVWNPPYYPLVGEKVTIYNPEKGWDKQGTVFVKECLYHRKYNVCEVKIGLIDVIELD